MGENISQDNARLFGLVVRNLTLDYFVVCKVQVEQKEHVQSCQGPANKETRCLANCPGDESSHLEERKQGSKESGQTGS